MKKIIFLLLFFIQIVIAQSLDFNKEIINIDVYPNFCSVTGEYFFHNDDSISTKILYPFVINDSLSFPDSVSIMDKDQNPIPFSKVKEAVTFPLKKTDYFKAYYRQKVNNNYFEYILTTTSNWGKPLDNAYYIIKVHNLLDLVDLSIPYNKIEKSDEFMIYYINRSNYMPKRNIIIQWREQ